MEMHYIRAIISMGLFGWLGMSVLLGSEPGGSGSGKSRTLVTVMDELTGAFGREVTGFTLLGIGFFLALFFVFFSRRDGY